MESSLKQAGYVILNDKESFTLTHEAMNFTIEDTRTGFKKNYADAVKEEDFAGSYYALAKEISKDQRWRKACLRVCPKHPNKRAGTLLILSLDEDTKATLRIALSQIDPRVCDFLCGCVDDYNKTRNVAFESSDVRAAIDEVHGHGAIVTEMKPPVVRIEFKR